MTIGMMKYIDVLTPAISDCPKFTVDINEKMVPVLSSRGPMGVWGKNIGLTPNALMTQFQNRDNIRVLSIGMFVPENFAFTSGDFPWYDNSGGTPAPVAGLQYTAMFDSDDGNGTWYSGHLYKVESGQWYDMNRESPSPQVQLSLSDSTSVYMQNAFLPGYGCSDNGVFVLPFPNYELVLDLYCDIANNLRDKIPADEYYLWGTFICPNVSMVGVPSDLDGRIMRIVPFVKIAHTCPIIVAAEEPAPPPEPPIADFEWRDHDWEEHADPHGDEYHNDPLLYPIEP